MSISGFDDLLIAARQQTQPHRLLFVFAHAELPEDSSAEQRARFSLGEGGALVPVLCVDKIPGELLGFDELARETQQFGHAWTIVFAAALPGIAGDTPTPEAVERALQTMVESIKVGTFGTFIAFDHQGQVVTFG